MNFSTGPDATLIAVPLKEMGRENHRVVANLPQTPPVLSASKARFVVSWWNREVHVWSLRQTASDLLDTEDVSVNQNRKLLKTIVVKGDSNIASATINDEGTVLVIATSTDVKAFSLSHDEPERPADVDVSSLSLPSSLTESGATRIQLSPDGKWLSMVQNGSRVVVAELDLTNEDSIVISSQKLGRLTRKIPRYITNGGLGSYERNITHLAFAPDSAMLAVADLAGYIDTWILGSTARPSTNGDGPEDASSDDSDSEDEQSGNAKNSSQWIRNPKAKLLPKLPATPVALSFSEEISKTEGSEDDYTLVAVTSAWNILAFHPLEGSLTPWSRRHPGKALPAPVQDLLDLAKGIIWQGSRLWIYGVSFLFMLDMSQDLPFASADKDGANGQQLQLGKRKRTGHTSGAGGRMEHEGLKPQQIFKHTDDKWQNVDVDRHVSDNDEDGSDDDMPDAEDGELTKLRNNAADKAKQVTLEDSSEGGRKKWWITYKYRPVLGVVPLQTKGDNLEVALVERPMWDVETKESYFAGEAWQRK